jgi:hypothetical protein
LGRNRYVELEIKKPKPNGASSKLSAVQKPCDKMAEAIVMDGGKRGLVVKVCADPTCRVHHPNTPSPQQVERERAEERPDFNEHCNQSISDHERVGGYRDGNVEWAGSSRRGAGQSRYHKWFCISRAVHHPHSSRKDDWQHFGGGRKCKRGDFGHGHSYL